MPQVPKYELKPIDLNATPVGQKISEIRKKRGFTQIQLGEEIGISQKRVTDYERGRLHINEDMLIRFAIALKVSADTLLGLNESDLLKEEPFPLRYTRRMKEIDKLPEAKKKAILQTLDDLIKANS